MPEWKRLRRDVRNGREDFADVIGKAQCHRKPVVEDAGVEVDLGEREDVSDHLFKITAAVHSIIFRR
jgi:hypothetical protein